MSLRQQQLAVFLGTVIFIFSLFATGVWLIANRLTQEATLQTALVMARQVEIALADSLRQRPLPRQAQPESPSSFWSFLGNIFPGTPKAPTRRARARSRQAEVKGLMRAFVDRSGSIEAMWVLNAEGRTLYSSLGEPPGEKLLDPLMAENLRRAVTSIHPRRQGESVFYDVLVPLQMPEGVKGPGGLRLWVNPADWTELISGMWRQLMLLFALGGAVALASASLTTALYTKRFRLISETLRRAEAGTYEARPLYASDDEVGTTLDLIDRLVMKQRKSAALPGPAQRLALAARTLAHEVRTPLNALAIHVEVLRNALGSAEVNGELNDQGQRSIAALDSSVRQVERLIRDFSDYSAPVGMERTPLNVHEVLTASLDSVAAQCAKQKISIVKELPAGPWIVHGDAARLRQCFDNLLRNAIEAQPEGGEIHISADKNGARLEIRFRDHGPGVPPERRVDLFAFGKTTKPGGSGIGLPLSQLIVESHGGSLNYEDRNGTSHGATFLVTLPVEAS